LVQGFGSLRDGETATEEDDSGAPKIEVAPARIYSRRLWVLLLTFAILGAGGAMLYRRGEA
jgi:hypothetical protein